MKRQSGFSVLGIFIFIVLLGFITQAALELSQSTLQDVKALNTRSENYYRVEAELQDVFDWLRDNSENMLSVFKASQFSANFALSTPSVSASDGMYAFPTSVKSINTGESIIISNDALLGRSNFPLTNNVKTGVAFDANRAFAAAGFSNASVKVTLINVVLSQAGDYIPNYRLDVMTATDRGIHLYAYITANLSYGQGDGFYGADKVELRKNTICDSYDSSLGGYSGKSKTPNCLITSLAEVELQNKSIVYGSVKSNGILDLQNGSSLCADFTKKCPNPGVSCQGANCGVGPLAVFDPWSAFCPKDQGNLVVSKDSVLTVASNSPTDRCWNRVTIEKNVTLSLTTTSFPYFIKELVFEHKNNSDLVIAPASGRSIELNVERISVPQTLSGQNLITNIAQPTQFVLNIHGDRAINISNPGNILGVITAPKSELVFSGNFHFYGRAKAASLRVGDNTKLHYDLSSESAGLLDVEYALSQVTEWYRQ